LSGAQHQLQIRKIIMLLALAAAISPFIMNGAVEFTKFLTGFNSTAGKRFLLAIVAFLGAMSFSALNGTPLDMNSVSSILQTAFEAFFAFFAAHGSYSILTGKTIAPEVPNA
jgi:hypothetical protein